MSDMVSAGNGPLTLKVSGSDVVFSQLTFRDRRDVMSEHRKVKRKELKDTLTEAGVPVLDQIPDLRQFDNEIVGFDAFISLFYSHDGKDRLLAKSIDKTQPGKGDGIVAQIDWTDDETMEVCAYLCRIQLARKKGSEKKDTDKPNPTETPAP